MRNIKEGDKVKVYWVSSDKDGILKGVVEHIPTDVGDSWYIRNE